MMINNNFQEKLRTHLKKRLDASHRSVKCLDTMPLVASMASISEHQQKLQTIVVLSNFEISAYVNNCLIFLSKLTEHALIDWYHQFTTTIFLIGNIGKLASSVTFLHIAEDGSSGWCAPASPLAWRQQTRILKQFKSMQTLGRHEYSINTSAYCDSASSNGVSSVLQIAVRGLTLNQYLIHLNHAICEIYIMGLLKTTTTLIIKNVEDIVEVTETPHYVRVHIDSEIPDQLRAYALLSIEKQ